MTPEQISALTEPLRRAAAELAQTSRRMQLGEEPHIDVDRLAAAVDSVADQLLADPRWRAAVVGGAAARAQRVHALTERVLSGDTAVASPDDVVLHLRAVSAAIVALPYRRRREAA